MELQDKDELKQLRDRLAVNPTLVWDQVDQGELAAIFAYGDHYKTFLDRAKTEREAVVEIERQAKALGFVDLARKEAGPRGYYNYRGKTIVLVVQGRRPLSEGLRVVASHIDSPRLDLKQYPLYEDTDLAFLKTHYYGGIKKYQWLARPLAIHGVVLKADGTRVQLQHRRRPTMTRSFPCWTSCPTWPASPRWTKRCSDAFEGEKLNVLVGSELPLGMPRPRSASSSTC